MLCCVETWASILLLLITLHASYSSFSSRQRMLLQQKLEAGGTFACGGRPDRPVTNEAHPTIIAKYCNTEEARSKNCSPRPRLSLFRVAPITIELNRRSCNTMRLLTHNYLQSNVKGYVRLNWLHLTRVGNWRLSHFEFELFFEIHYTLQHTERKMAIPSSFRPNRLLWRNPPSIASWSPMSWTRLNTRHCYRPVNSWLVSVQVFPNCLRNYLRPTTWSKMTLSLPVYTPSCLISTWRKEISYVLVRVENSPSRRAFPIWYYMKMKCSLVTSSCLIWVWMCSTMNSILGTWFGCVIALAYIVHAV